MTESSPTGFTRLALVVLTTACLTAMSLHAGASFLELDIGGVGDDKLLDPVDPADGDDTGIRVLNLAPQGGKVKVSIESGARDFNLALPDGFLLLDNTLHVTSDLLPGGLRLRPRLDFGRYGGRAGIRARGIRVGSLRVLRADFASGRWIRAIDSIRALDFNRERVLVERRFLRALKTEPVIGNYGIDLQKEFAWAVVNTSGDQYFALGGLGQVPLPAAWMLFLSGTGLLAWSARRRRPAGTG